MENLVCNNNTPFVCLHKEKNEKKKGENMKSDVKL
jgi:hypothetical protein